MRRGHTGIGGWRNENQRHFRPRIGGNQHYRPPRGYGLLEIPRYPQPSSRSLRPQPFNSRSENPNLTTDISERPRYRDNYGTYQRPPQHRERNFQPMLQRPKQSSDSRRNIFKEPSHFYKDLHNERFHVNSMGDVDHRPIAQMREAYRPPVETLYTNKSSQYPGVKSHNIYKQDRGEVKPSTTSLENTGHRPPASDHYGCNPVSVIDNSHTFSRSVDDTVDLIRKRLLNRSEPQNATDSFQNCENDSITDKQKIETIYNCQNVQIEQPVKKKYQKQNNIEKTNCAKIKSKIVHQLFKMDKEKIHKLMDNPNSSTKFEYAISSLITESQNSYNRHLRSAAEKSLCSSSTEFMQNNNNTIYEDTFMKQMQCILDPQDTVFLEDIKPIVMAELNKVLQLNEYKQNYDGRGDDFYDRGEENHSYNQYPHDAFTHDQFLSDNIYSDQNDMIQTEYSRSKSVESNINNYEHYQDNQVCYEESNPLYERRKRIMSNNIKEGPISENPFYNRSVGDKPFEDVIKSEITQDLFDTSATQFSEDEDPFEDLDNQYHVAVDHDFIECDDISSPQERDVCKDNTSIEYKTETNSSDLPGKTIEKEIDTQIKDTKKSSVKSSLSLINNKIPISNRIAHETKLHCKQESFPCDNILCMQDKNATETKEIKDEQDDSEYKEMIKENDKSDISTKLPISTSSNTRKRPNNQRSSHRKEKRKKIEPCSSEASKQILNKNIIINVNDCASKTSDKCEVPKSIFNLFFSKEKSKDVLKDNKKIALNDKNFTEKHVKRKETSKKECVKDRKTKRKEPLPSNLLTSPKDDFITKNSTTPKPDTKITLKPIDMFVEQPRKASIHQAHRNTALTPDSPTKVIFEKNLKPLSRQLAKKHVAVQVIRKLHAKETQTSESHCCNALCKTKQIKTAVKSIQTDINIPEKSGNKSIDAFERMKEIDLEIQVLLQEKFKLYSSIETKDSGASSMQTLGMTVLNVNPYNSLEDENEQTENMLSEDTIVNDFANIPVEQLEQIAFESVQEHQESKVINDKRTRRRTISYQEGEHSESPITVNRRKNVKAKSPNISLIEQIITDDRPLEDIISLDDLEVSQTRTKDRNQKTKKIIKRRRRGRNRAIRSIETDYKLKECTVVLVRADLSNYFKFTHPELSEENILVEEPNRDETQKQIHIDSNLEVIFHGDNNIIEETVENGIQFDMLDVSEDIIVGESCEVKSLEDKEEVIESLSVPINEEIILDNSQSSSEDIAVSTLVHSAECKVYDYSADENLRCDSVIVNGNADAVLAIECVENNFLAACLDGNVYYFNAEGQLITTLRGSNLAVTCLTIVKEKYGTTVYTGSLDSRIRYYDLETGIEKGPECNVLSPIQTMDRAWDTVFVGTRTGFVLQFECKNNMLIPVSSVKFSEQSILALRAMKEGPRKVLLVAARSENVTIKDAQTGLLLRMLDGPKMTVYTLLYEDGKVYCGTSSHQIHVFDYTSGGHVGTHEGGKGAVCLRATGGLLFAGCYDGCVYVYRDGEGQPFAQIRGPSLMLLSLAVVGSKIIAGYKDRSLYIWKIPLCILQEMIL